MITFRTRRATAISEAMVGLVAAHVQAVMRIVIVLVTVIMSTMFMSTLVPTVGEVDVPVWADHTM